VPVFWRKGMRGCKPVTLITNEAEAGAVDQRVFCHHKQCCKPEMTEVPLVDRSIPRQTNSFKTFSSLFLLLFSKSRQMSCFRQQVNSLSPVCSIATRERPADKTYRTNKSVAFKCRHTGTPVLLLGWSFRNVDCQNVDCHLLKCK
jgi:hypothetical protein